MPAAARQNLMTTEALINQAHGFGQTAADALLVEAPSLGTLLAHHATAQPDAPFLRYFDDEAGVTADYSYAQFWDAVRRAAAALHAQGLREGDCVASLSHNHPLAAVLLFAGWTIGLVVAPQNVAEDDARIAFILRDAGARLLIAHRDHLDRARRLAAEAGTAARVLDLDELGGNDRAELQTVDYRRYPALLVYTSGTTGQPKGVVLTQYNLMINARGTAMWHAITPAFRLMCVLPIHHVNGIVVTLITTVFAGASVVLNRSFKASTFWRRLSEERVAIVSVVPTILQFLHEANEDLRARELASFRYFICGAGTLPLGLVEKFEQRFGMKVLHGYGLSETTAFNCTLPTNLSREDRQHWLSAFGYPSIGTVLPFCEMAIHDADGRPQPAGQRGEIVIRGHYVMAGYFHRPDANAETFRHGWFRSGDEGFFECDAQGRKFFFISGRLKELINRGGVKYSPFEIEDVLLAIPGVRVGLAIGFDNDWYSEEVGAYVVRGEGASLSEADILAACRTRLPFAKCPKVVVFGDEVPVTVTGKYQRLKLKPLFAAFAATQFQA